MQTEIALFDFKIGLPYRDHSQKLWFGSNLRIKFSLLFSLQYMYAYFNFKHWSNFILPTLIIFTVSEFFFPFLFTEQCNPLLLNILPKDNYSNHIHAYYFYPFKIMC